jgi:hypothetical protein
LIVPDQFNRKLAIKKGWRQCSIFSASSCPQLYNKLVAEHKVEGAFYLVLSHPCSLLNPNLIIEPYLEYIVCEEVSNLDGNASFGKNPRLLHIELEELNGLKLKLEQRARGFISKISIANEAPLFSCLSDKNESLIVRWMANRYVTTALPDEFEARVAKQKSKLTKAFSSEVGINCKAVYISLNEFVLDLAKEAKYECILVFLLSDFNYERYASEEDGEGHAYNDFLTRINKVFQSVDGIDLKTSMFISENVLTIGQLESGKLKRWQFDYISVGKGGEIAPP